MAYRHDAQVPLGSNYEVDVAPDHGPYDPPPHGRPPLGTPPAKYKRQLTELARRHRRPRSITA